MALEKVEPQVRLTVLPPGSINTYTMPPLAVSDIFAGYLTPTRGSSSNYVDDRDTAVTAEADLSAKEWQQQKGFERIDSTLDFITLLPDNTVQFGATGVGGDGGPGGFILKAREVSHNSVVEPFNATSIKLPEGQPQRRWQVVQGPAWSERISDREGCSAIYCPVKKAGLTCAVQTSKPLAANEGFLLVVQILGRSLKVQADLALRVIWGNDKYSLIWRYSRKTKAGKLELQRRVNGAWQVWQPLPVDNALLLERTPIRVEIICSLLIITIGVSTWWFPAFSEDDAPGSKPKPVSWDKGPLRVNTFGTQAAVEFSSLTRLDVKGKPITGSFERLFEVPSPPARVVGHGVVRGWKASNAGLKLTAEVDREKIGYEVTLTADTLGRTTPLASSAIVTFNGATEQATIPALELRPYLGTWDYSGSEPEVLASSEFRCEINRASLDKEIPSWRSVLKPFSPMSFELCWQYRDTGTGELSYGEWTQLFDGYVLSLDRATDSFGMGTMSLVGRCNMVRMQEPAGFIGDRYAPLDLLFATGAEGDLYGGECIRHLLEVTFGTDTANQLNSPGAGIPGDPLAFFPEGHYPLLSFGEHSASYFTTVEPFQGSGFKLPPPFGSYLEEWVKKIAGYDHAVFYWGVSPLAPLAGVVPIYGRYTEILRAWDNNTPVAIPEAIISSVGVRYSPERNYNEFLAWGKKMDGDVGQLVPTFSRPGSTRLPPGDPNSAENSWPRTLLTQLDYLDEVPGSAQDLAVQNRLEFEGREIREITIMLPRGDATIHWGQAVAPSTPGDASLNIGTETFRVKRVNHTGDCTGQNPDKAFTTELVCRPVSAQGY